MLIREDGELLVWKPAPAEAILQPEAKFYLKLSSCVCFLKLVFLFNLFFSSLLCSLFSTSLYFSNFVLNKTKLSKVKKTYENVLKTFI